MANQRAKLCVMSIGLSFGILWSASLFIMGILAMFAGGYGVPFVIAVGKLYVGYAPTYVGSLIGAAWGFLDAFIGGIIFAWLYNCFVARCKKCASE